MLDFPEVSEFKEMKPGCALLPVLFQACGVWRWLLHSAVELAALGVSRTCTACLGRSAGFGSRLDAI